jgi:hypothetical protein
MFKIDPKTLLPYVSGPIVGTEFRELLAAIWGRDMKIEDMPLFPPGDCERHPCRDSPEGRERPVCARAPFIRGDCFARGRVNPRLKRGVKSSSGKRYPNLLY